MPAYISHYTKHRRCKNTTLHGRFHICRVIVSAKVERKCLVVLSFSVWSNDNNTLWNFLYERTICLILFVSINRNILRMFNSYKWLDSHTCSSSTKSRLVALISSTYSSRLASQRLFTPSYAGPSLDLKNIW